MWLGPAKDPLCNSSYYSWACHSAVFVWKRGIRVIVLKRKCFMYISSILMFWLFCRTSDSFYWWWGITQPMDAPSEVTRWNGRSYRGISIAFVIWREQAPLNIWTCSPSQKYVLEVCFPILFAWVHYFRCWSWPKCLTFMCFHHWTAGSTVITAIEMNGLGFRCNVHNECCPQEQKSILQLIWVYIVQPDKESYGPYANMVTAN